MKAIVVNTNNADTYVAESNGKRIVGKTIGEAVESICNQLRDENEQNAVIYVQEFEGDEFFSNKQIKRLSALMEKWRYLRDKGEILPAVEQEELENLIELELEASGKRVEKVFSQIKK